jgi:RHS repeat-associated protein
LYVYDGLSEVEEGVADTSYRMITGTSVDEKLSRGSDAGEQYFLRDALGSTTATTDGSGAIVGRIGYDAYGVTSGGAGAAANKYLYAGREMDDEDLYFYRSRYYLPAEGRFLSEDSMGIFAGQPNIYQYVGGAPTNFTDASGHCPTCLVGGVIGAVIGGVAGYVSSGGDIRSTLTGALVGGATGALGGLLGPAAGAVMGELGGAIGGDVGGAIGGALGRAGMTSLWGGASGALGTAAGNYASNKPTWKRAGYGAGMGAIVPLISGEALVAGAGDIGLGLMGDAYGGMMSGGMNALGGAFDPLGDCAKSQPPEDQHFPWPSMAW